MVVCKGWCCMCEIGEFMEVEFGDISFEGLVQVYLFGWGLLLCEGEELVMDEEVYVFYY